MSKPTVLFIHGSWHSPAHFEPVRAVFEKAGYPTSCPRQPSAQGLPTAGLAEDADSITSELVNLIEVEEREVIVVAHSYGGVIASQAVRQHFARPEREKLGKKGGVLEIVYMCAFLLEKGQSLIDALGIGKGDPLPPFMFVDV
jgi:pimeloyl-ACP methyl ester carboxylesterase